MYRNGGGKCRREEAGGELLDEQSRDVERVKVGEAGEREQVGQQQRLLVRPEQSPEPLGPFATTLSAHNKKANQTRSNGHLEIR